MTRRRAWSLPSVLLLACTTSPQDPAEHCPAREEIECAEDVGGVLPLVIEGTTVGRADGFGGSRCGIGGGIAVEDAAFRWTAPYAGTFQFSTEGSSIDTILSVRQGSCTGREMRCSSPGDGAPSTLTLELEECETVTVVVDGRDATDVGAFTLRITSTEVDCGDGEDEDRDGLTDCDDSDCAGDSWCESPHEPGDWPAEWAAFERGVLEAVNRVRAEGATCGGEPQPPASPLQRNVLLERAARGHSLDMAEQDYFSHESLDGRTFVDRIAAEGYVGSPIGENIATGYPTVEAVMNGWMNSPGHCLNIMDPTFRAIGVGYASGPGGVRWTQNFGGSP